MQEICGARIEGETVDVYPNPVAAARVPDYDKLYALIGKQIDKETTDAILEALEMEKINDALLIPTYRVDVTRPCDVAEEVLRIYGYNNIEIPDKITASYVLPEGLIPQHLRDAAGDRLASAGFREIMSNCSPGRHFITSRKRILQNRW